MNNIKSFGLIIFIPLIVIGQILFNSWYLQVIYNIGLTPILCQFSVFLPQLGFWVFVLIDVVIGGIVLIFDNTNKSKSENDKKTYNIWDADEMSESFVKVFSLIISNILTKLMQLGLLTIAFNICF